MVKACTYTNGEEEEEMSVSATNKKQRITGKDNNTTQSETIILPHDVLVIILSMLPAKSLAKFRCVCEEWLSLTHDPRFLKSHHQRSSSNMIIDRYVVHGEIYSYDFSIGDGRKPTKTASKVNLGRKYYMLSNFVDGLTCAYATTTKSNVYLLNPLTRELQKLPKKNGLLKGILEESFGLGIDLTMGKYKVVRLFYHRASLCVQCEIYSVGARRWRRLGEAPFDFHYNSDPVFLQGALYWLGVTRVGKQHQLGVFRFDIKDEKFVSKISIDNPPFCLHLSCLRECRGRLWLVFDSPLENYFEIWTMKDHLNDTWVKEYKFHGSSISRLLKSYDVTDIIKGYDVTNIVDGEIHFRFCEGGKWHVICYNPCSGALHKLFVGGEHGHFSSYKESLISPKILSKYLNGK